MSKSKSMRLLIIVIAVLVFGSIIACGDPEGGSGSGSGSLSDLVQGAKDAVDDATTSRPGDALGIGATIGALNCEANGGTWDKLHATCVYDH